MTAVRNFEVGAILVSLASWHLIWGDQHTMRHNLLLHACDSMVWQELELCYYRRKSFGVYY